MNVRISLQKLVAAGVISSMVLVGCGNNADNVNVDVENTNTVQGAEDNAPQIDGTALVSELGDIQITLPDDWKEDNALNPAANLSASNRAKEKYIMILSTSKSDLADGATVDDFVNIFKESTSLSLEDFEATDATETTIDGEPAKQIEVTGVIQKVKVHYLVSFLSKGNRYYQIVTWSTQSLFGKHKDEFDQISKSLKVLKEDAEPETPITEAPATGGESTKDKGLVLTSDSGLFEITVPSGWKAETNLTPGADIQAARMAQEDYLAIIVEPKESFSDDATIDDYLDLVINNGMLDVIENSEMSDPQQVEVNGQPALQFTITGSVDKLKVGYLMTLVETDGHYSQVIFWTLQQMLDSKISGYKETLDTFKAITPVA